MAALGVCGLVPGKLGEVCSAGRGLDCVLEAADDKLTGTETDLATPGDKIVLYKAHFLGVSSPYTLKIYPGMQTQPEQQPGHSSLKILIQYYTSQNYRSYYSLTLHEVHIQEDNIIS